MQPFADLQRDVRYAIAGLLRHPLFAASAVATIGLGIGAATSVFDLVDSIYLRQLPVPAADRLLRIEFHRPGGNPALGIAAIRVLRAHAPAFDEVVAHESRNVLFARVGNRSIEEHGAFVSANYWSTLGIKPRLGRFFVASEDSVPDRDPVVVVSSAFWHAQLGDDPTVIGRHIGVMGRDVTIIGVAPEEFRGVAVGQMPNDLWLPMAMASLRYRECLAERFCRMGEALARLAPHATRAMADAQLRTLEASLSSVSFADDTLHRIISERAAGLSSIERREYLPLMKLLTGIAAVMLLIACANLSGLLVARGVTRYREMAVRVALGASRWRLTRQLLTESLLIALAGGLIGLIISAWVSQGLLGFFTTDDEGFQHFFQLALDAQAIAFTAIAATTTAVLFGVLPALTTSRVSPAATLKESALGAARAMTRAVLVGAQVTLSVALLAAAILLARSAANVLGGQRFDSGNVVVARWRPDLAGYSSPRWTVELGQILDRLRALPNVESVGFRRCCGLLWSGSPSTTAVGLSAFDTVGLAQEQLISPAFFATLKVPLLAGREFTASDRVGEPQVAIVSRSLVSRLWSATINPAAVVGREVRIGQSRARIVGVVPDYHARTLLTPTPLVVFQPFWQTAVMDDGDTRFAIRVRGDVNAAVPAIVRTMSSVDPLVLVTESMAMRAQLAANFVQVRIGRAVLLVSAGLALFLSAMGLYGVIAFLVARRSREVGIRLALGAPPASVTRLFVRHGMRSVVAGAIAGLVVSFIGTHLLGAWLVGVTPNDVTSFAAAAGAVVAVGLVATYLPAKRASRMDPAATLRVD